MRFVIDQQLPPALLGWLRARGHDAEHVRDIGLRDAEDAEIWRYALGLGAAIVTKDGDFATERSRLALGPTIVWLRIGNSTTPELLDWLDEAWPGIESALLSGVSVTEVRHGMD